MKVIHGSAEAKNHGDISMGTTIVAATFKGGVVLGSDGRTSTGIYVASRATDKITKLTDHIYALRSGSAADTQAISRYVVYFLKSHALELGGEKPLVSTAAALCQQLCYHNKEHFTAGMIVGGWDNVEGGSLYNIPLGGSCVKQPFTLGGSGSGYLYGYCDENWRDYMDKEECVDFVKKAVMLGISRDGSSGGSVRLVIITKDGAERRYVPGDAFGDMKVH